MWPKVVLFPVVVTCTTRKTETFIGTNKFRRREENRRKLSNLRQTDQADGS
jgi:hypothetical protein